MTQPMIPTPAANAPKQIVAWVIDLLSSIPQNWESFSMIIAAGAATYLVVTLFQRSNTDEDPSLRMQQSSAAGSTSVLISGVYVTMGLLGIIAFVTWPLPLERPIVGVAMIGAAVYHYYLEKREVSMN